MCFFAFLNFLIGEEKEKKKKKKKASYLSTCVTYFKFYKVCGIEQLTPVTSSFITFFK